MGQIFISYSHQDMAEMQKIKASLLDSDFTVWTDEQITPGTPTWQKAIEQGIEECRVVVVLLSPNAKESKWVREEISYATGYQKKIFTLLIKGEFKDSIPIGLINHQHIDIRSDYQVNIKSLFSALAKHVERITIISSTTTDSATILDAIAIEHSPNDETEPSVSEIEDLPPKRKSVSKYKKDYSPAAATRLSIGDSITGIVGLAMDGQLTIAGLIISALIGISYLIDYDKNSEFIWVAAIGLLIWSILDILKWMPNYKDQITWLVFIGAWFLWIIVFLLGTFLPVILIIVVGYLAWHTLLLVIDFLWQILQAIWNWLFPGT